MRTLIAAVLVVAWIRGWLYALELGDYPGALCYTIGSVLAGVAVSMPNKKERSNE